MVKIKEILCLFVPPVLIILKNKLMNRNKPLVSKEFVSTIGNITPTCDKLVVIGNGPSLNDSIKEQKNAIIANDCVVVNQFCKTDYYTELKPKYYLLADPAYFGTIDNYTNRLKNIVLDFIESIVNKTTWDINLIVPSFARDSEFINAVKKNHYIHVYFYNNINAYVANSSQMKYDAWDHNLIAPPAQTCLNTCVWLGIFLRYKKIYLIGADTTWIELLHVDQETNEVYTIDSHFYGTKRVTLYSDEEGTPPQKLHDELNCISRALSQYWELKYY
ncbi:MAG: hypothetical protein J5965_25060, partial [Aeriscardovia sp.]|nr:hypothetical protein [Aeriscardovia sp.]